MANSQEQLIGFLFGTPLATFNPECRPTQLEVIRHWMYLFDERKRELPPRSPMTPKLRNLVIHDVVSSVVDNWRHSSNSVQIKQDKFIFTMVKCLVKRTESFRLLQRKGENEAWLKSKRMSFSKVFTIGHELKNLSLEEVS